MILFALVIYMCKRKHFHDTLIGFNRKSIRTNDITTKLNKMNFQHISSQTNILFKIFHRI